MLENSSIRVPITGMQKYMFDYQLHRPKSTMYNLCFLFKLSNAIQEEVFAKAVVQAIQAHPILHSAFYFDDHGDLRQKSLPDQTLQLEPEYVSELELTEVKKDLVQPFDLINKKMYRCRLFKTEAALYLFLDIHHTIIDGLSFYILLKDISKAYRGQTIKTETYSFFDAAQEEFEIREKLKSFDTKQHYDTLLQGWNRQALPKVDKTTEDYSFASHSQTIGLAIKELHPFLLKHNIDENIYFLTVMSLTTAIYNNDQDSVLYWIHNGRNSLKQRKLVGLMIKEHLVRTHFPDTSTIADLLQNIKSAVNTSMEDSFYPYHEYVCLTMKQEIPCYLFQGNIRSSFDIGGEPYLMDELPNPHIATQSSFDVEILVDDNAYQILIDYCAGLYKEESIQKWTNLFNALAIQLLEANTVGDLKSANQVVHG